MKPQELILPIEGTGRVLAQQDGRLGSLLAQEGKLDDGDIERVLALQGRNGLRFGEAALALGVINADELRGAIARQFGFPQVVPGQGGVSPELVAAYEPLHPRTEELRSLRAQLLMRWPDAGPGRKLLAVISPASGDGRSYLAANLAVLFAQLGRRTLLIDADLRAPRQHRIFDLTDRVGLSTILSGRAGPEAALALPEFGPLSLLPAGVAPPNPQDLLLRPALGALLESVQRDFDVVLLDTPPARPYADAQCLAFHAGRALLLARRDRTRLADAASLVRSLGNAGTRIIGTVFNDARGS
ncbi:MAG TPA: chain length determinant protein tyrosine kinase EpsG [Burkholderiales bacterium]